MSERGVDDRRPRGRAETLARSRLGRGLHRTLPGITDWWHGARGFAVLTYHRIGGHDDEYFTGIPIDRFASQMQVLAAEWNVLPLGELVGRAGDGTLPPRSVGISFDDNYLSVHEHAIPVLLDLGLAATIFVPTGPLTDGVPLWYDRVFHAFKSARVAEVGALGVPGFSGVRIDSPEARAAACGRCLAALRSADEAGRIGAVSRLEDALSPVPWTEEPSLRVGSIETLREAAAAGIEIASHSVSHPIFSRIETSRVRREVRDSRAALREWFGTEVDLFAYPNGKGDDFDGRTREELAAAGYRAAFTTQPGVNRLSADNRFELRRFDVLHVPAAELGVRLALLSVAA